MENNQRNSRKRLNSLILLVAFTAVMLIVSTYAWFSTQKNVTISGLKGKVNVAEGLQISLDGSVWVNSIDLSTFGTDADGNPTTSSTYLSETGATFENPYTFADTTKATNVTPKEFLPASTTGTEVGEGITTLKMYRGDISDNVKLGSIGVVDELSTTKDPGYFAFDVFLANNSGTSTNPDPLQLEPNSSVTVNSGKEATGLQNTLRVGFALYDTDGALSSSDVANSGTALIAQTKGLDVEKVAIWEPNAYTDGAVAAGNLAAHVDAIVKSMTYLKLSSTDASAAGLTHVAAATPIDNVAKLPTYALTEDSIDAETIQASPEVKGLLNTFDWTTPATGLEKQVTLQTPTKGTTEATKLIDATAGTGDFTIPANKYVKMRIYVWLEGQDVDCLNTASLGGGVTLNIGFSKPGTQAAPGGGGD